MSTLLRKYCQHYTLLDELNLHIKYFKWVDILTYYTPSDPTKDKEPRLNKGLQKKWLPQKTVAHKQQLEKENEMKARNRLMEGPSERAKARKRDKKDQKIVRVMKKVPMTFYTCNANHITNKMPILAHDAAKHKFDVIHITEAGLKDMGERILPEQDGQSIQSRGRIKTTAVK